MVKLSDQLQFNRLILRIVAAFNQEGIKLFSKESQSRTR